MCTHAYTRAYAHTHVHTCSHTESTCSHTCTWRHTESPGIHTHKAHMLTHGGMHGAHVFIHTGIHRAHALTWRHAWSPRAYMHTQASYGWLLRQLEARTLPPFLPGPQQQELKNGGSLAELRC